MKVNVQPVKKARIEMLPLIDIVFLLLVFFICHAFHGRTPRITSHPSYFIHCEDWSNSNSIRDGQGRWDPFLGQGEDIFGASNPGVRKKSKREFWKGRGILKQQLNLENWEKSWKYPRKNWLKKCRWNENLSLELKAAARISPWRLCIVLLKRPARSLRSTFVEFNISLKNRLLPRRKRCIKVYV